jgi:hypothetical protein
VALQHLVETCPAEHVLTITPREPFPPYPGNLVSEPTQSSTVAADAVVGEVAPHQRRQMFPYLLRLQAPRAPPMFVLAEALLMRGRPLVRPGSLLSRRPTCRHGTPWAWAGHHRFPGDPSCAFALLQDPGRSDRTWPSSGLADTAPGRTIPKASACTLYRGYHRALASAVYASRTTSPPPMQDSLPAGGLRLRPRTRICEQQFR